MWQENKKSILFVFVIIIGMIAIIIQENVICDYRKNYVKICRYIYSDKFNRENKLNDSLVKIFIVNYFIRDSFNGIIINKFTDDCNHGVSHIDIEDGDSLIFLRPYRDLLSEGEYFYKQSNIGDSISKEANDSFITLYGKNNIIQYNLANLVKQE